MHCKRRRQKRFLTMRSHQHVVPDLSLAVYVRSGGRCHYCGVTLSVATMTLDHVVPVNRGGTTCLDNLVASCAPCNQEKGGLSLAEFMVSRGGAPFPGERQQERSS